MTDEDGFLHRRSIMLRQRPYSIYFPIMAWRILTLHPIKIEDSSPQRGCNLPRALPDAHKPACPSHVHTSRFAPAHQLRQLFSPADVSQHISNVSISSIWRSSGIRILAYLNPGFIPCRCIPRELYVQPCGLRRSRSAAARSLEAGH